MFIWAYYAVMLSIIICSPRRRRVAIILFALVFIKHAYGVAVGMYNEINARKLIKPAEVILSNLREERDMNFRQLYGRITNKSRQHSINAVALKIFYKDCETETNAKNCSVIGEESTIILKSILPGETVDFNTFISSNQPVAKKILLVDRLVDYVEASKVNNEKSN